MTTPSPWNSRPPRLRAASWEGEFEAHSVWSDRDHVDASLYPDATEEPDEEDSDTTPPARPHQQPPHLQRADATHPPTSHVPDSSHRHASFAPSTTRGYTPDDDSDNDLAEHWTLRRTLDVSKFGYLLRLSHKLGKDSNYVAWMTNTRNALVAAGLFEYCVKEVPCPPSANRRSHRRWHHVNSFVRTVLTNSMSEEAVNQLGMLDFAHQIWRDAKHLYAGQTLTDYTHVIAALMHTKFVDTGDLNTTVKDHIAKFKSFNRDLVLMNLPIADQLFATFLRLSFPPDWNYIFAGLGKQYTSIEVERRIRDEAGVKSYQLGTQTHFGPASTDSSYLSRPSNNRSTSPSKPKDQNPNEYCTNCKIPGHTVTHCFSRGGNIWKQRNEKKDEKKDVSHMAIALSPDVDTSDVDSTYFVSPVSASPTWILDGGSAHHICSDKSLFSDYTSLPPDSSIGSISHNSGLKISGQGSITFRFPIPGQDDKTITMKNVLHAPNSRRNIISESVLDKRGLVITKKSGQVTVAKPNGDLRICGSLRGSHYFIHGAPIKTPKSPAPRKGVSFALDTPSTPSSLTVPSHPRSDRLRHIVSISSGSDSY